MMKREDSAKVFIVLVGLLFIVFSVGSSGHKSSMPVGDKNSASKLKLPYNTKETYSIQSKDIPTFTEAVFNPLYSRVGVQQRVTVKINSLEPIISVSAEIQGDTATVSRELKFLSGSPTDGAWEGVWKIEDTHAKIYTMILRAKSASHNSHIDLNFE